MMKRRDKHVRFQVHAIRRMRRRGIDESQVMAAITHPDTVRSAKRAGALRFEKRLSPRRRLAVIAEEDASSIWVITAFLM